jgi:hypothetical protein
MFAFKLKEALKCEDCGDFLPPYLTRYHRVILFTETQKEAFGIFISRSKFDGKFIEYLDQYPTIGFEDECRGEVEGLRNELKAAKEEIKRLADKLKNQGVL